MLRIRVGFRADPDADPDLDRGLNFWSIIVIYLSYAFIKDFKLHEKCSALKREHPALQNKKFLLFSLFFVGNFCSPGFGSGSSRPKPVIYADPDPKHCFFICGFTESGSVSRCCQIRSRIETQILFTINWEIFTVEEYSDRLDQRHCRYGYIFLLRPTGDIPSCTVLVPVPYHSIP